MIFRSTIAATFLLAGTAFAAAQTIVVTPEQETVVREYVKTNPVVVDRPSNFELVVGAIIPDISSRANLPRTGCRPSINMSSWTAAPC